MKSVEYFVEAFYSISSVLLLVLIQRNAIK